MTDATIASLIIGLVIIIFGAFVTFVINSLRREIDFLAKEIFRLRERIQILEGSESRHAHEIVQIISKLIRPAN